MRFAFYHSFKEVCDRSELTSISTRHSITSVKCKKNSTHIHRSGQRLEKTCNNTKNDPY